MIKVKFSVRAGQGEPSGFDLGDILVEGERGAANSGGHVPDQGMMIYPSVTLLLDSLRMLFSGRRSRSHSQVSTRHSGSISNAQGKDSCRYRKAERCLGNRVLMTFQTQSSGPLRSLLTRNFPALLQRTRYKTIFAPLYGTCARPRRENSRGAMKQLHAFLTFSAPRVVMKSASSSRRPRRRAFAHRGRTQRPFRCRPQGSSRAGPTASAR